METPPPLRLTFIFFIIIFLFSCSWYSFKLPSAFSGESQATAWLHNSKSRLRARSGSVPEIQIHEPRNHMEDVPHHPLDPLTMQEIYRVRTILSTHPPFSPSFPAIHSLSLDEPRKDLVLSWKEGDPLPPRKALVIALLNGQSHVLSVDLDLGLVTSNKINRGSGYPMLTMNDISVALEVALSYKELNRSAVKRGLSPSDVTCVTPSAGWFGPSEEGRRVIKVQCFSNQGTPNFYMRPLEGLTMTVDIDKKVVVKFTDTGGEIPVPKATGTDYRFKNQKEPLKIKAINPISIEQPLGPSFTVEDGHVVKWANWEFHLKADQRAGMVISRAMLSDSETGVPRSVMYKGFSSELFVPYMDPDENWYFKSYMDAGEFGMGATAMSLVPLNDCPRNSYYMDGIFASWDGTPFVQPNMICVFERYAGDISWRHSEIPVNGFDIREARPKVTLVARMAASVGNYDYIFDWEFQTDGLIHVTVALSGMLMVKGTPHQTVDQMPSQEAASGPLVSENAIGVLHDHFITFHLDMDIDDTNNTFVKVDLVKERTLPGQSPRKSYLKAKRNVAKTEDDARIQLKLYEPSEFQVINPSRRSRLGNPAGYKIVPGGNAASLLDHLDPPQLRSAFTNNQVFISRQFISPFSMVYALTIARVHLFQVFSL
ncbi:hypothetical protein OIU76_017945 [Salix suchowensis]|nr:hypothetical protein OIU76_017945 [Salix suchowensis]KAJ6341945.1 hypothetical protein OIU78_009982 [Salix suchowensis]